MVKTLYQEHPTNAFRPIVSIEAGTFEGQAEKLELRCMGNPSLAGFEAANDWSKAGCVAYATS